MATPLAATLSRFISSEPSYLLARWDIPTTPATTTSVYYELTTDLQDAQIRSLRLSAAAPTATFNLSLYDADTVALNAIGNILLVNTITEQFQLGNDVPVYYFNSDGKLYLRIDNTSGVATGIVTLEIVLQTPGPRG